MERARPVYGKPTDTLRFLRWIMWLGYTNNYYIYKQDGVVSIYERDSDIPINLYGKEAEAFTEKYNKHCMEVDSDDELDALIEAMCLEAKGHKSN